MCATCGSKVYGQNDAAQLTAIAADKVKLEKVRAFRASRHQAKAKNKQLKKIK